MLAGSHTWLGVVGVPGFLTGWVAVWPGVGLVVLDTGRVVVGLVGVTGCGVEFVGGRGAEFGSWCCVGCWFVVVVVAVACWAVANAVSICSVVWVSTEPGGDLWWNRRLTRTRACVGRGCGGVWV